MKNNLDLIVDATQELTRDIANVDITNETICLMENLLSISKLALEAIENYNKLQITSPSTQSYKYHFDILIDAIVDVQKKESYSTWHEQLENLDESDGSNIKITINYHSEGNALFSLLEDKLDKAGISVELIDDEKHWAGGFMDITLESIKDLQEYRKALSTIRDRD